MRIDNESLKYDSVVVVSFYASADTSITASDICLGHALAELESGVPAIVTLYGLLPVDMPQGAYYIGWIIDPDNRWRNRRTIIIYMPSKSSAVSVRSLRTSRPRSQRRPR
jgi:hypothetical protein